MSGGRGRGREREAVLLKNPLFGSMTQGECPPSILILIVRIIDSSDYDYEKDYDYGQETANRADAPPQGGFQQNQMSFPDT